MKRLLSSVALATLLMTGGALAQSSTSAPEPSATGSGSASPGATAQTQATASLDENSLKQDLERAGFKDLHFVNAAYVVAAKTSSGDTVVMAINPALVTTGKAGSANAATSGSGSSAPGASGASGNAPPTKAMNRQELRQSLEKSGFQDVEVVRAAYVIAATTPKGERVALTVSPLPEQGGAGQSTSPNGSNTSR